MPNAASSEGPDKGNAGTILVVDDEAPARRLLTTALHDAGYDVIDAKDGFEALSLLSHADVALVLLDNRMPRLSGVDVLRRLRQRSATQAPPVILVTGADDLDDRIGGLDAGASDYVTKPYEVDEVLARVRAQLRGRDAWGDELRHEAGQRSVVARALSRALEEPSPERASRIVCEELAALSTIGGATLIWFVDDLTFTVATSGLASWGLSSAEALPLALASYVRERAASGPWVERVDVDGASDAAMACAPLSGAGEVFGVLATVLEASASVSEVQSGLATAVDFAAVASSLFAPTVRQRRRDREVRVHLEEILDEQSFTPLFQPIVRLSEGDAVGYEALARFADGVRPDVRFAEAANVGLGLELERATLSRALAVGRRLPAGTWLSVNVSPRLILADEWLGEQLARQGRRIVIELSEHERVDDYAALHASLRRLPGTVDVGVDDVGAGFASLRHVLVLHPAFMKLDLSWVRGVESDPVREALVSGLVEFATRLGCQLVAEGVETPAERQALLDLGVPLGQGYLFGRPQPV
jgi:EAL domain-containing protein (putative c-di-GMP-specific phosphodiesterase class I)/DNA-binding response OmpR family regulator